jgi:hypothetical protein
MVIGIHHQSASCCATFQSAGTSSSVSGSSRTTEPLSETGSIQGPLPVRHHPLRECSIAEANLPTLHNMVTLPTLCSTHATATKVTCPSVRYDILC